MDSPAPLFFCLGFIVTFGFAPLAYAGLGGRLALMARTVRTGATTEARVERRFTRVHSRHHEAGHLTYTVEVAFHDGQGARIVAATYVSRGYYNGVKPGDVVPVRYLTNSDALSTPSRYAMPSLRRWLHGVPPAGSGRIGTFQLRLLDDLPGSVALGQRAKNYRKAALRFAAGGIALMIASAFVS